MKFRSRSTRPIHLGSYALETLNRRATMAPLSDVPPYAPVLFEPAPAAQSIIGAMGEYQAILDVIRDGLINKERADCPLDPIVRANHMKAFGYFSDASMVGVAALPSSAHLQTPLHNPDIGPLSARLRDEQIKSLASGIDQVVAELRETLDAPLADISTHTHTLVFVYEYPRDPKPDEAGAQWIQSAQRQRACLRAAETAVNTANLLRLYGYPARAHSGACSDVDLNLLAVAAGLGTIENGQLTIPYLGTGFELAAVTTTFEMQTDQPLAPLSEQPAKARKTKRAFAKRRFVDGAYPFETLKRVEKPTTFIDEARVPRVPKRTDMFPRALFGDMGKKNQEAAKGGHYVKKSPYSWAQRRALGALTVIQNGPPEGAPVALDPKQAADNIKAACYFLGADAVGISRCPDWTWYSHDAGGEVITPPHDQAISVVIDQGYETMEGSSGDDWIGVAQSMRAYLRFSLLGGVIAKHIRRLGYSAKAHTVIDGEVLQPPLLLLAGLGEVSRIGEVILNPFLGPRLKSGVITTDLPLAHDAPIDFGLQSFCNSCNKCARECPSGAITAGPKLMFNGYETWKSDSQKCLTYRVTTLGGAMCGRCMKTCPWNLEGLFSEAPFRWAAMHIPKAAPALARLDDALGNGNINPVKTWWWDLAITDNGGYRPTPDPVNQRAINPDFKLRYEDQTLAVYPAPLAPHPYPYPFPMDREAGITAYQNMISAKDYKARLEAGDTEGLTPQYTNDKDSPVTAVIITKAQIMADGLTLYEFTKEGAGDLPQWEAGAHIDVVVAPDFLRQYSLSGNPSDRSKYQIGVLREPNGRGGSDLLHRIFTVGRKVFVSLPRNHFALKPEASKSYLMGGGIGITPMIAFAHSLHEKGESFELHYSFSQTSSAGYLEALARAPWAKHVHLHDSSCSGRADFAKIFKGYKNGHHIYTCGPDRYMQAVLNAAQDAGFPEPARHLEYFSVPELPEYENHDFTLRLTRSQKDIKVSADQSASDALLAAGVHVDVKCADGLCGACKCPLIDGEAEHRDFVLSKAQREISLILCQSRAAKKGAVLTVDL